MDFQASLHIFTYSSIGGFWENLAWIGRGTGFLSSDSLVRSLFCDLQRCQNALVACGIHGRYQKSGCWDGVSTRSSKIAGFWATSDEKEAKFDTGIWFSNLRIRKDLKKKTREYWAIAKGFARELLGAGSTGATVISSWDMGRTRFWEIPSFFGE